MRAGTPAKSLATDRLSVRCAKPAVDAGQVGIPGDGGQPNRGPVLGQDEVDQQGEGTRSWNR